MADLTTLPQCSNDVEHQKTYIRFIVKALQIFDEEIVEKQVAGTKTPAELQLSQRIKDWVR